MWLGGARDFVYKWYEQRIKQMTERLYYKDPYLIEFEATITDTGTHEGKCYTVLDRSAFYPTSGGQQHDVGRINDIEVIDVIENAKGDVWHISTESIGSRGERVSGRVDAKRRMRHRQQHTAQHLLSQSFLTLFGLETVSVHLGQEYGAVELNVDAVSAEQLAAAEKQVNRLIAESLSVEIVFLDAEKAGSLPLRKVPAREGEIRVIKIDDYDYSACGGTHCRSTSEVLVTKLIGTEKMRGNTLVKFLSGAQAIEDYGARFRVSSELSQSFTCHVEDLPGKVAKLEQQAREYRQQLSRIQKEMLPQQAERIAELSEEIGGHAVVVNDVGSYDAKLLGALATTIAGMIDGLAVLLSDQRLVLASTEKSKLDSSRLAAMISSKTELKGGGSARQAQLGGARPDPERIRGFVEDFLTDA